jgi:hypothetical protein
MGSAGSAAPDGAAQDWGRQLGRSEKILWYGLAGATYCAAAIFEKGLLNWIVGPIWLVLFISAGPVLADRLRGRRPDKAVAGAVEPDADSADAPDEEPDDEIEVERKP